LTSALQKSYIDTMVREPKEDPWVYVYTEFGALAAWWANRHYKDPDDVYDCRIDLLVLMTDAYEKYRARGCSIFEVNCILKTIPLFYYKNKVKPRAIFVRLTEIEDIERAQVRYDNLYEYFMRVYYKLYSPKAYTAASINYIPPPCDALRVLEMVLFPSQAFKRHIAGKNMTVELLLKYFSKEKHWTYSRFENALRNLYTKYKSLAG
jgi:hypothetical protein